MKKSQAISPERIEAQLSKGEGFMYVEPEPFPLTPCPHCKRGHVTWVGTSSKYTFVCSLKCGWVCPDEKRVKALRKQMRAAYKKLISKQAKQVGVPVEAEPTDPKFLALFRAECDRRMEILLAERAKFPPTFTKKGKPNLKFTEDMRAHMHTFAFTSEQVRDELLK